MDAPIFRFDPQSLRQPHIRPSAARVSLEITKGKVRERLRLIQGPVFLIGTANDCDLVLGDLSFPEAYAYVFVHGTEVSVRRLGAGPLLFVDGESVETADLLHGDSLSFGPFELRVSIDEAPSRSVLHRDSSPHESEDAVSLLLADIRRGLSEDNPLYP